MTILECLDTEVDMPNDQMDKSAVRHTDIGTGRLISQDLSSRAIATLKGSIIYTADLYQLDKLNTAIRGEKLQFSLCNYPIYKVAAFGHTLQPIYDDLLKLKAQILLTAANGNIELKTEGAKEQFQAPYSKNQMLFLYFGGKRGVSLKSRDFLSDFTAKLLNILGLPLLANLTNQSLLIGS